MEKFIPLSIPNFEGNEEKYVVDAIASTFVSTVGGDGGKACSFFECS